MTAIGAIEFAGHLQRVELGPNDRLILTTETPLSPEQGRHARELIAGAFEIDPKRVIAIDGKTTIGVIGKSDAVEKVRAAALEILTGIYGDDPASAEQHADKIAAAAT